MGIGQVAIFAVAWTLLSIYLALEVAFIQGMSRRREPVEELPDARS